MIGERLALIGVPTSAGAFASGQEQAPAALREVGLIELLREAGVDVNDRGDREAWRWRPDRVNPRAQNLAKVIEIVTKTARRVTAAVGEDEGALQGPDSLAPVVQDAEEGDWETPTMSPPTHTRAPPARTFPPKTPTSRGARAASPGTTRIRKPSCSAIPGSPRASDEVAVRLGSASRPGADRRARPPDRRHLLPGPLPRRTLKRASKDLIARAFVAPMRTHPIPHKRTSSHAHRPQPAGPAAHPLLPTKVAAFSPEPQRHRPGLRVGAGPPRRRAGVRVGEVFAATGCL